MSLIHREVTPEVAAANRANAQKSTGPATTSGKLVSRANALKHWGRAEAIRPLLGPLGEDPAEFQAVRDGFYEALNPRDAFEAVLVGDMAEIHWRLRRLIRAEAAAQAKRRLEEQARRDEEEAKTVRAGVKGHQFCRFN